MKRFTMYCCWALCLFPALALADAWMLDNGLSRLSFVTIKAGDAGEVHSFKRLSGQVSAQGAVAVAIDLASVDTLIPIRDERMRELLFNVAQFPSVEVATQVDVATLAALAPGDSTALNVSADVGINGRKLPQGLDLLVSRLAEDRMLVATRAPFIVNAASVGYVEGVERLRVIAGLPRISKAVTVTFVLVFTREDADSA